MPILCFITSTISGQNIYRPIYGKPENEAGICYKRFRYFDRKVSLRSVDIRPLFVALATTLTDSQTHRRTAAEPVTLHHFLVKRDRNELVFHNNIPSIINGAAIHNMRGNINRLSLALLVFLLGGMAAAFEEEELEVYDVVEDVNSNFYEFLELKADASSSDIRKAYRRLSLSLHPDKGQKPSRTFTICS